MNRQLARKSFKEAGQEIKTWFIFLALLLCLLSLYTKGYTDSHVTQMCNEGCLMDDSDVP